VPLQLLEALPTSENGTSRPPVSSREKEAVEMHYYFLSSTSSTQVALLFPSISAYVRTKALASRVNRPAKHGMFRAGDHIICRSRCRPQWRRPRIAIDHPSLRCWRGWCGHSLPLLFRNGKRQLQLASAPSIIRKQVSHLVVSCVVIVLSRCATVCAAADVATDGRSIACIIKVCRCFV
jgi:hypothetical protein